MVHVTERLSTTARVAPSPSPNAIPVTPQAHIYKLEAAEQLPVLNLRLTISWLLCTPERNLRFLRWNKRQFRTLSHLHRIGAFVGFVALVVPRPYGLYLTFPSLLCCLPAICCSYAMLSIDMVRILFEQYDFWFFTAVNLLTWTLLTWLVWDVRVLLLANGALTLQLTMFLDANFRTFVPAVKSCAIAIPVILVLSILVAMKRLDALPEAYAKTFQIARLQLQLVDLFLNTSVTLVLFLIRKTYTKRKLLQRRNAQTRVVGCVIYHAKLQLRAMTVASHHSEQSTNDRPSAYETHVLRKQLGITAHKLYPALKTGRPAHYRQQLTLVSLRLSTIDTRRTLWSRWCQHSVGNLLIVVQVLLYVLGAAGLFCTAGSLLLPSVASTNHDSEANMLSQRALLAIPFSGFAATTVFVTIFVLASQIDILRALIRNFNFLFPSLQCTLASLCLADTMRWDYRVWAIAAFWLWFHWILVLDAVTPPVRTLLGFRKSMVIPVVVGFWFGIASVAVALFVDSPILSDRVLLRCSRPRERDSSC
ncbi:hypothetical protein Poli38472_010411 [Pythium oligandrum]|uniref:Uncharacterized protein n=1 Tax=Pythium oligandrum TaxID=41045 RepID=A0A8K1FC66_PYTOL|nr:hypothetical protein Poli38472_010411 [Pythium oligandrum]|eukprot:TMW55529.1 hypothetical protein Poli38472_010411 [Pythium oligandrum]